MKKLIAAFLLMGSLTSFAAYPIFHKSNGGWFGYKFVTSTDWGNGVIVVACTDPGLTRCKVASGAIKMHDGPDLTQETFDQIDKTVSGLLTPDNTSGKLLYNDTFFVTYSYDIDKDDLTISVYSKNEAKDLGLL